MANLTHLTQQEKQTRSLAAAAGLRCLETAFLKQMTQEERKYWLTEFVRFPEKAITKGCQSISREYDGELHFPRLPDVLSAIRNAVELKQDDQAEKMAKAKREHEAYKASPEYESDMAEFRAKLAHIFQEKKMP